MRRRLSATARLLALCVFISAAPVQADVPDPGPNRAEAAQRFDRGLALFNEGDNAGALAEFKQTYAIMPNPIVLYNIGLVYAAMGRPVDAVDALGAVVGASSLSPEQRERAQSTLTDQRARVGRVSVTTLPDGARIDIDGVEVARTPLAAPLRVAEGSHVIGAVAEGYAHAHKEIVVAGNADASVSFELVLGQNKVPANLTVRSRIADVEVWVDLKLAGKTPLTSSLSIPSGHHTVELRRAGYTSAKQELDLGEGATAEVALDLTVDARASLAEGADFALDLREPNLDLTVDDVHLGLYTQPLRLPKGVHHVHLEASGYVPFDRDVTLEAGKPNVLAPFLVPTTETRQAHDSNVRWHRTVGWIGVGAGAAIAGVGVALAASGSSSKSSAQKDFDTAESDIAGNVGDCNGAAGGNVDACNARVSGAQTRIDSANGKETLGFVSIGVGAAVLVTGVVLLFTGESSHRFDAPARRAGSERRAWSFLPGPGRLGLGLGASF